MNKNELKKLDIEALVKLATEKGVTVPDGASKKDVIDLIVVAEKASKPENKTTSNEPKKDVIYYLLKVKCFVSSTETWQKGLYRVTRPIARLDGSCKEYVERFDGTIQKLLLWKLLKCLEFQPLLRGKQTRE
jgi:hypothetical protein